MKPCSPATRHHALATALAAALAAACLASPNAQAAPVPIGHVAGTVVQDSAGFEVNVAQQTYAQAARQRSDDVSFEAVSSEADLAAGTLKVKREVQLNYATQGYGGLATGLLGDGFVHQGEAGAFDWSGQTATFKINIDGSNSLTAGPGDSFNFSIAFLIIYRKGTLDNFLPFCNGDTDGSHVYNNVLASFFWSIGEGVNHPCAGHNFTGTLDGPSINTTLTASFQPGDDFDWVFGLRLGGAVNTNLTEGVTGTASWVQDFGSTATLNYVAPDGATVFSNSGVFPGTQAQPVPEPGTWALALLGLAALGMWRRGAGAAAA